MNQQGDETGNVGRSDGQECPSYGTGIAQFERYRSYLLLLARMQVDPRWQARIDPSDLVQQTLLDAHARWHQLGSENAELAAWLRKALSNNLADALRNLKRAKRDAAREQSLDAPVEESSQRLANWLAAEQSSPSTQAVRNEDLLKLADALISLPELQREAIMRFHLQGKSLRETAVDLDRSEAATAGLLHRGLKKLRELMSSTGD